MRQGTVLCPVNKTEKGFFIGIEKRDFSKPVECLPDACDFPDRLYADYWEKSFAWGSI